MHEAVKLKSNFDLMDGKFIEFCIAVEISENLLESKPFKTSGKLPYFKKNQLCTYHIGNQQMLNGYRV